MLRITIHDSAEECRFHLSGRLEGPGVAELRQSWQTARSTTAGRRTTLDLRALEAADSAGQALLQLMFDSGVTEAPATPSKPLPRRRSFALAAPLLFLLCPVHAAGAPPPEAGEVLDRYLSASADPARTPNSSMRLEIRAHLAKYGRTALARVVETIPRTGRAAFRLTAFEGDDMVKRQVIARYLAAEAEAHGRDDGSLAIAPANYRFRFLRREELDGTPAVVFQLQPKKKRSGLFRGELWLAADSGRVLRQSGRMVKTPSLFLKQVAFTRDFDAEGLPRSLDLRLDTRIAGAAELNVRYERADASE